MSTIKINNNLNSKEDVSNLLGQMFDAVMPFFSQGRAELNLGDTGYHYTEKGALLEALSRLVWGLGPMISGGGDHELLPYILDSISNGTNPDHKEYWGTTQAGDQKFVEMAALSFSILLQKETFYEALSETSKSNYCQWLDQINHMDIGDNNWNFFRVLVCLALDKVGYAYDDTRYKASLESVDQLYCEEGWYRDGSQGTFDFYNPFAFHFYAMVYYKEMKEIDRDRCERYKARTIAFAQQYKEWFSNEGGFVPYGRSLSYRFAQASFFCATAYAGIEVIPWGECKYIVLENLRYWMSQKIFDHENLMTIGYTYPNMIMAETYNAPGSPYWALKVFAILALDETHPFWTAEERALTAKDQVILEKVPGFLVQRREQGKHIVFLSGKQNRTPKVGYYSTGFTEKYMKFAYSSRYGFSVSRSSYNLEQGAFDSMLALREVGHDQYRVRMAQENIKMSDQEIVSRWHPWPDVTIITTLIPYHGWHIRIHDIDSPRALETAEGGFCIKREAYRFSSENHHKIDDGYALTENRTSCSVIADLSKLREPIISSPAPNTNIMFSKTELPMLVTSIGVGKTRLVSAVFAGDGKAYCEAELERLDAIKSLWLQ